MENLLIRIEILTRKGNEFALIPVEDLQKLLEDAEMLADVRAYDAPKARLDRGDDELITLAKVSKVSRGMIAGIEAGHKTGGIATLKKLAAGLNADLENLT